MLLISIIKKLCNFIFIANNYAITIFDNYLKFAKVKTRFIKLIHLTFLTKTILL